MWFPDSFYTGNYTRKPIAPDQIAESIAVTGGRYWVRTSDPCCVKANEDL